jgi:hypothetical protein
MQPAFAYYEDLRVTVYQDDAMFWKFYCIPDYVSIRRDFNGNPVFLLVKYAFSDEDREENPELGRGGGYMAFDVEMSVRESDREELTKRLQQHVDDQWNQLKAIAENHNKNIQSYRITNWSTYKGKTTSATLSVDDVRLGLHPDAPEAPPGDRPPRVILSTPTWTEGTFEVSAPQSEDLISHRVTSGPVSLVGNNTAAVNMDLTEAGATFMQRTLTEQSGAGATDMTPIQVTYRLKFWARVPPIKIRIEADSRSLYQAIKQIDHDYDGHSCSEDDMYHYESYLEAAYEANLISVKFDTGHYSFDNDFIQEVRQMAMSLVMEMIRDRFFETKDEPVEEDDGTSDFINQEKDVYYVKIEQEVDFSFIGYEETISSVVAWPANPQGTLQAFLAGLSASEMRKYVREINLEDDFFKTLGLHVTAFADWEGEPIDFIEVQLMYSGRDETNQLVEKTESFTLTKDNHTGAWDPSLIGAKREYEYRYRVGFTGEGTGEWTRWERSKSPQLNISVADPGKVSVMVMPGSINFEEVVDQVQVELRYADSSDDIDEEATVIVLNDASGSQTFERYIFTAWDKPVTYKTRFFLKDGQQIETDEEETLSRQLLINAPLFDTLDVRMVPTGLWTNVIQSVISLRYDDEANNYHADSAYSIKAADEFKTWAVVLRDRNHRVFAYKLLTSFKDGTFHETDWTQADGDQALRVAVEAVPWLKIDLLPNLLDFTVTPIVQATLRYNDEAGGVQEVETFTFSDPKPQTWTIQIADEDKVSYSYEITYHKSDGTQVHVLPQTTDATSLIIPKLVVPDLKVIAIPRMLNFTDTPVVELNIDYQDPDNHIDFNDTLVFTDGTEQEFRISVREDSPREYSVSVTYHLADGTVVERAPATLDQPRIIVPRYIPNGQ